MSDHTKISRTTMGVAAVDETTPLIGAPENTGIETIRQDDEDDNAKPIGRRDDRDENKPMPYVQVLLLCYTSTVEPISYFAIFPIISDMLVYTGGLQKDGVAFWSGFIEAMCSIVQMLVMILYGKLADRIGRKPVLVFSLLGISFASAAFGFAQSLWQMILLRAMTGLFAGAAVTIRSMLSENTTKHTQSRAFSWFMFARNIGIFIGPLIGGSLANPVKHFPAFRGNAFFTKFPYSLSMLATGAVCLSATIAALIGIKETLQSKTVTANADEPAEAPLSTLQLLKSPGVVPVVYLYGHVMLLALMYTAVDPVFMYEPITLGGFNFDTPLIGVIVAIAGASQAVWMLGPFTPLQKRVGTGNTLRLCAAAWPLAFASLPLCNELLRHDQKSAFWTMLIISTMLGAGVSMSFACVQLQLNDVAPSPATLGTLNAIALTINSAIRSFAPVLSTTLYEASIKWGVLDGHLFWLLMIFLAFALYFGIRYLPEAAEGRPIKPQFQDEAA